MKREMGTFGRVIVLSLRESIYVVPLDGRVDLEENVAEILGEDVS